MEKTFDTVYGEVSLREAIIDIDGTNLADGIVIKIDGEFAGEVVGAFNGVEDMTIEEVEAFVEEHSEL